MDALFYQSEQIPMKFDPGRQIKSFGYALNGLKIVLGSQQNFRIHLVVALLVIVSGKLAGLTNLEWCVIVLTISLVLAMEIINTAIEKLVDLVSPDFHPQAGIVKDIAAAAVLLTAIGAVIVGLIIFLPKLI
jgi:diacylglycerol kinase (ATP)